MTGHISDYSNTFRGSTGNPYSNQPAVTSVQQPFGQYYSTASSSQTSTLQSNWSSYPTQSNTSSRPKCWYYSPSQPPVQISPAPYISVNELKAQLLRNPYSIPHVFRPLQPNDSSSTGSNDASHYSLNQPLDPWIQQKINNMTANKLTTRPFFTRSDEPNVEPQVIEAPEDGSNLLHEVMQTLHGNQIPNTTMDLYGLTSNDIPHQVQLQEQQVEFSLSQQTEQANNIPVHHILYNPTAGNGQPALTDDENEGIKHAWCPGCKRYIPKTEWL